jgi:hypothetical protein
MSGRAFITDLGCSVADVAVDGDTHLAREGGFDLDLAREGGFDLDRHPAVPASMARVAATPGFADLHTLLAG